MEQLNRTSSSDDFQSPVYPNWGKEESAPQESTQDILTFGEEFWSDDIQGFVTRARDSKDLLIEQKVQSLFELASQPNFKLLKDKVAFSILAESQLTKEIGLAIVEKYYSSSVVDYFGPEFRLLRLAHFIESQNETILYSMAKRGVEAFSLLKRGNIAGMIYQLHVAPVVNAMDAFKSWMQGPAWKQAAAEEQKNKS